MSKALMNQLYVATTASTSEDSEILKENIAALAVEGLTENCRYNQHGPVEFICGDPSKELVENEVISQIEDEALEEDCHLIRVTIRVEVEYL